MIGSINFNFPSFSVPPTLVSSQLQFHSATCQPSSTLAASSAVASIHKISRPALVFVTPENFSFDIKRAVQLSQAVLYGGATLIQIRDQNATPQSLHNLINSLISSHIPPSKIVVNGITPKDIISIHPELGIHIKEKHIQSLYPQAIHLLPSSSIIGCAVHSVASAQEVMSCRCPHYLQVGTMFTTNSHPGKVPEGPELLADIRSICGPQTPLIGIGGINQANVSTIINSGADGAAVISLLAGASKPASTAASLLETMSKSYFSNRNDSIHKS